MDQQFGYITKLTQKNPKKKKRKKERKLIRSQKVQNTRTFARKKFMEELPLFLGNMSLFLEGKKEVHHVAKID